MSVGADLPARVAASSTNAICRARITDRNSPSILFANQIEHGSPGLHTAVGSKSIQAQVGLSCPRSSGATLRCTGKRVFCSGLVALPPPDPPPPLGSRFRPIRLRTALSTTSPLLAVNELKDRSLLLAPSSPPFLHLDGLQGTHQPAKSPPPFAYIALMTGACLAGYKKRRGVSSSSQHAKAQDKTRRNVSFRDAECPVHSQQRRRQR